MHEESPWLDRGWTKYVREVGLCRIWTVNPLSHRRGKAYSFRDAGGLEDFVAEDEE